MASLSEINASLLTLRQQKENAENELTAARRQYELYNTAEWQQWIDNYYARRRALNEGERNEFSCLGISNKNERNNCTTQLQNYLNSKKDDLEFVLKVRTRARLKAAETRLETAEQDVTDKEDELAVAKEIEKELSKQGLTSEAVEAAAVEGEKQKAIIYSAQADALAKQAEIDNQARRVRNYIILGVIGIVVIVGTIWLIQKLRKKKK